MSSTVWQNIRQEAKELVDNEPMLASFFHSTILKHHDLGSALSYILANKLANTIMPAIALREIIEETLLIRGKSRTIRRIQSTHYLDRKDTALSRLIGA